MNAFRYEVVIRWPGNPDFNQAEPIADSQIIHADTLVELVAFVKAAIARHDAGSGNFAPDDVYRNGQPFCTVSYNGRCWGIDRGMRATLPREVVPAEVDAQTERDITTAKAVVEGIRAPAASKCERCGHASSDLQDESELDIGRACLSCRLGQRASNAREHAGLAPRAGLLKTMRAPRPGAERKFCWACGTTHSDDDRCIPRSE